MEIEPDVKLLLRLKRGYLQIKAKEAGVSMIGTKLELATRIAIADVKRSARYWAAISNG